MNKGRSPWTTGRIRLLRECIIAKVLPVEAAERLNAIPGHIFTVNCVSTKMSRMRVQMAQERFQGARNVVLAPLDRSIPLFEKKPPRVARAVPQTKASGAAVSVLRLPHKPRDWASGFSMLRGAR